MEGHTRSILYLDLCTITEKERHSPNHANHHLVDNREPEMLVELRQHRRPLLDVADEAL